VPRSHSPGVLGSPERLCSTWRAPCWTFRCPARCHAVVPDRRPPMVRSGSRALGVVPLQSLHILPAARCSEHRIRLPRGSSPLRRHHPDEPRIAAIRPSRCGSALRFSRPLSGFLAGPGSAALFRAAAARGVLPSEHCSSLGSRAPLGVACFLAVLHHRT
jgi:hypothetical protein